MIKSVQCKALLLSPSSYACTGFADSKHSVDDLRLNIEEQSKSYFGYAENEIEIFNTKEMLYAEKKLNLYLVVEFALKAKK